MELLTVKDVATKLNVPKSWVYSRTRETGHGILPHLKLGKYVRFEELAIDEWVKSRNRPGN